MVLGILQARVGSTRLPGKVLRPILGLPMIIRQIERLSRVRRIDRLVLATSTDEADDGLAQLCEGHGVCCFRGSLNDVLDRFYQAAGEYVPEHVVRLTGDCPLIDPDLVDRVIACHVGEGNDYTSNTIPPTYPDGLDVEVVRFRCLQEAWKEAVLPSEREHVTPFVYRRPDRYKIGHVRNPVDLSSLRWTVDEPEDFDVVTAIYEALYPGNPMFTTDDILAHLDRNPALKNANIRYGRNEGYLRSLEADEAIRKGKS